MKQVYRHRELAMVTLRRDILQEGGIDCVLKNEDISITEASIPPFWPTLYVINDNEAPAAEDLIRTRIAELSEGVENEIICPKCNEANPGNFDLCWSCGAELSS